MLHVKISIKMVVIFNLQKVMKSFPVITVNDANQNRIICSQVSNLMDINTGLQLDKAQVSHLVTGTVATLPGCCHFHHSSQLSYCCVGYLDMLCTTCMCTYTSLVCVNFFHTSHNFLQVLVSFSLHFQLLLVLCVHF